MQKDLAERRFHRAVCSCGWECCDMKNITISILMANYNYGQYIREALDAIFAQTYSPMEVIICDDGSTDNSVEIIKEYMKRYPGIKFMQNEKNMGGIYTVNRCLEAATGDYIYSAASDDKVLPGFFEKSMGLLMQYPQAGLCFCDWAMIEGNKMIKNKAYLSDKPCFLSPEKFVKILLNNEFYVIGGSTVVVKRSALMEAGGYIPALKSSCDIFAHHVISFRYGVCYIPEIMSLLRKHAKQYSAKVSRPLSVELNMVSRAMDILLTPEYADVLPKFKQTTPFSHRSWDVLKLVLSKRKYRCFFSVKLLRYAFFDRFIRRMILPILPMRLWRIILNEYKYLKYNLGKLIKRSMRQFND